MHDILYLETTDQVAALLKPKRIDILKRLAEPHTCAELGEFFGETPQRIYYHVKALEKAGLVAKISERRVRGTVEGRYQAAANAYYLAPHLASQLGGGRAAQDQTSLRYLLSLAEEVQDDIGRLAQHTEAGRPVASLSMSAQIYLPGERRAQFLAEVEDSVKELARKYGAPADLAPSEAGGAGFRLVVACYPHIEREEA